MAAGYLQVGWLLFGTYELAKGERVSDIKSRFIVAALFTTGVGSVFASLITGIPTFLLLRLGIRSLAIGLAFLAASYIVFRFRQVSPGFGQRLVSVAFLFCGIQELVYFVISLTHVWGIGSLQNIVYLGFSGFVLQSVMGLGMVVWLLEEERARVVRVSEQIEHLAYHDSLTGLPNRQLFLDRLRVAIDQSRRTGTGVAVLFLDLDRFKIINDSLGHSFGDELLSAAGERLERALRDGDTVARLGGDEFALLLNGIQHPEHAGKVAEKIIEALRLPFVIHDQEFYVTTSIGIGVYPDDGSDAETLLKNSDTAMYRAKEHGRDKYEFYTSTMNARALERLALENSLRKALANNEFVLFYQPVIDLQTGEIECVEALLRWNHPQLGLLQPADFLFLAETLGLMDKLNLWVLHEACRQTRLWHEKGFPGLRVAVNLSARPFQHPDFVTRTSEVLCQSGLDANSLELEITENIAMQDADASLIVLRALKKLGVRISIDDFGTGYSSLSYLRNFPIDTLKIDRSFVRDLTVNADAAAIASAVIALAHSLKIDVVAEGVETEDQKFLLKHQSCDRMQGHLFSVPLPASDCELLMIRESRRSEVRRSPLVAFWEEPAWALSMTSK
jgi:diguanylate cyclase (GGDEF)-like protein